MDWGFIFDISIHSFIGQNAVIYALAAIGLNVQFGYTGLLNFGQAAFAAVGGYGMATIVTTFGLPFWLGIMVGLGGALVLAMLLGVPTLRLRADYLAIVTIAASEILRLTFRASSLRETFGGSEGLTGFSTTFFDLNPFDERVVLGPWAFSPRNAWVLAVGWGLVIISCLIVWALMRSPWGRVQKAIREDEDAVRSLGKNVYAYKMQSLALGGIFGALAGFIFSLANASVQPDLYNPTFTFFAYTILILGGVARVLGPVVGAMIFWFLFQFLSGILEGGVRADVFPFSLMTVNQIGPMVFMLVGLVLILLLVFRPQGIFGNRKELAFDVR
jgi:ABC-type branched-subunit amino acid transport system permease subunit